MKRPRQSRWATQRGALPPAGGTARLIAVALATACRPDLADDPSRVDEVRVLAVLADPPEAAPGATVTYRALVASPSGPVDDAQLTWSFCTAPKPLTVTGTVAVECLGSPPSRGPGPTLVAAIPADACRLFGPDAPPGGYRPRDPDVTGGYYQPLRVDGAGPAAFAQERVVCNLAFAPAEVALEHQRTYRLNAAPSLGAPTARVDGVPVDPLALPAGRAVTLDVGWPEEAAEAYVAFDTATHALVTRREAMRASWYVTGGTLSASRTGRTEEDLATGTSNVWTSPKVPGVFHLWIVLRDARGGTAARAVLLTTR